MELIVVPNKKSNEFDVKQQPQMSGHPSQQQQQPLHGVIMQQQPTDSTISPAGCPATAGENVISYSNNNNNVPNHEAGAAAPPASTRCDKAVVICNCINILDPHGSQEKSAR